jgi:hypothetical protein
MSNIIGVLTINNSSFCMYGLLMILSINRNISLNSINQMIIVMVKLGVFFAAWTEFLNIMQSPVLTSIPETRT